MHSWGLRLLSGSPVLCRRALSTSVQTDDEREENTAPPRPEGEATDGGPEVLFESPAPVSIVHAQGCLGVSSLSSSTLPSHRQRFFRLLAVGAVTQIVFWGSYQLL
jgi:hypothetical protein